MVGEICSFKFFFVCLFSLMTCILSGLTVRIKISVQFVLCAFSLQGNIQFKIIK